MTASCCVAWPCTTPTGAVLRPLRLVRQLPRHRGEESLLRRLRRLSYQDLHDWLVARDAQALACGLHTADEVAVTFVVVEDNLPQHGR